MIDPRLVAFEAVLLEGSFERAAARLKLTQSAVSQRIKLLEAELGQALLVRSKPVQPTPAGRRLMPYLGQLRLVQSEAERALRPGRREGPLRLPVGVNADSLATWFLEAAAPAVRGEGLVLDCVVADQDHTHALLAGGDVLGAVSARSDPMRGCGVRPLGVMRYLCVASPEFAARHFPRGLTRGALARAPAIVYGRDDDMQAQFLRRHFGLDTGQFPHHVVPSSEGFVAFALGGLGYGFVPRIQIRGPLADGRLVDLAPQHHERVALYWHHWQVQSPVLARFAAALAAGAADALEGPAEEILASDARPG